MKTVVYTKYGQTYDVIFDMVAGSSYSAFVSALNPGGRYPLFLLLWSTLQSNSSRGITEYFTLPIMTASRWKGNSRSD